MDVAGAVGVTGRADTPALRTLSVWSVLDDAYLTLHVAAMGFTLVLPLLGAALSGSPVTPARAGMLLAIGASFHVFAYALNDVCDLPLDRREPQRADDPLVRGLISPGAVFALAMAQLPVMALLVGWSGGGRQQAFWLAVGVAGLAAYDRWGKACPWPVLTDAVQAFGWAALLACGATSITPRVTIAAAGVVAYILLVNGIIGPVRDLENDHACGARTTALWLGARARDGGVVLPARAAMYAAITHGTFVATVVWLAWPAPVVAQLVVAGLLLLGTWILCFVAPAALRDRRRLPRLGATYIGTTLGALVLAGGSAVPAPLPFALLLAFGVPVGLMCVRNGRRW
ncbi:MAG: UbiA family prenyltransferase [Gemmatimonadaceae bacterium]|nr:UbiA family prenyltransferase [Gemmatimonadaceae bacterium]